MFVRPFFLFLSLLGGRQEKLSERRRIHKEKKEKKNYNYLPLERMCCLIICLPTYLIVPSNTPNNLSYLCTALYANRHRFFYFQKIIRVFAFAFNRTSQINFIEFYGLFSRIIKMGLRLTVQELFLAYLWNWRMA